MGTSQQYKMSSTEQKQAKKLLDENVPRAPQRNCYEEFIKLFLNIEQTKLLCKYLGCNIVNLANEIKLYKETNEGESKYKEPPNIKDVLIIKAEDFKSKIGGGLENDVYLHDFEDRKYAVAFAKNHRLKKMESGKFRLVLENLTGRRWRNDEVSKYIFHMIIDKEKDVHKNNK